MSSYMKLFEDFLQKKEVSVRQHADSPSHLSEEEDEPLEDKLDQSPVATAVKSSPTSAVRCIARGGQKMEHSYVRDCVRPKYESITGLTPARTILVRRPPQCPYCHTNPLEENELDDGNQVPVPTFNEIAAKEAMCECARIAKYVKNTNSDDEDWEARINKYGWTNMQKSFFEKVVHILDNDQLGRLANAGRQNEPMQRRLVIDKSAKRMRKALASVAWDSRLTQWLHCLLMDFLPSTYMASYLDILQTLKSKLPTLMDKMLFGRPMNVSQELLAPVMKKKWEPIITATKSRKLSHNAVIVALPSMPTNGPISPRMQKWYQHLASITQVVQVTLPTTGNAILRQPLEQVAEQIVSLTRVKIQEMRSENPTRSVILIGFNAGSALALQVAMSENVSCVICMGFAFNTLHGIRGMPDDRILDIKTPILFVIGQNSARSSPEEIESLREKMQSVSSLVVVGSADDVLRIPKSRRKIENVTQSMVDTMIADEVYEFINKTLSNPPGSRVPTLLTCGTNYTKQKSSATAATGAEGVKITTVPRKRKLDNQTVGGSDDVKPAKTKYGQHIGRPRTRPVSGTNPPTSTSVSKNAYLTNSAAFGLSKLTKNSTQQKKTISPNSITNEDLNLAIQSILSDPNEQETITPSTMNAEDSSKRMVTNFELVTQSKPSSIKTTLINPHKQQIVSAGAAPTIGSKIKMIPANQFVQLKPPIQSQSKIYTIKTAGNSAANIGNIVTTSPPTTVNPGQQVFTLKSPNGQTTQFVTAAPQSQQKYTVVKPVASGASTSSTNNLDLSNIIDMPIIFADSEGNISETVSSAPEIPQTNPSRSTNSSVGQLIISQQIIKEANGSSSITPNNTNNSGNGTYIFNNKTLAANASTAKPHKVVFINRNTMKPCPNIISRSNVAQQLPKYTKVVVTNPKTSATTLVQRANTQSSVTPLTPAVKQVSLQTLKAAAISSIKQSVTTQRTNLSTTTGAGGAILGGAKQIQILNSTGSGTDKSQIRNIVVKPGGLKQIPPHLKTQLLNRNLTVRKLVNIVPASTSSVVSNSSAQQQDLNTSSGGNVSSSVIQTSPKIITLNPINPSAITSVNTTPQQKSSTTE